MNYKYSFSNCPWVKIGPGAKQKLQTIGDQQIRLLSLEYGFVEENWCIKAHKAYVLKGELEIDFDGETLSFKQGEGFVIEAGPAHKHKAIIKNGGFVELLLLENN